MKKSTILTLILLGLGIMMIISGSIILFQCDISHCGHTGGLSRASTTIEFGADFYTTSAQVTGLAANAITDLYKLISIAIGIFFLFIGGMDICVTLLLINNKKLLKKRKNKNNYIKQDSMNEVHLEEQEIK